jgi:hypothetical protein
MNSLRPMLPPVALLAAALIMLTVGCTSASPTVGPVVQTAAATPTALLPAGATPTTPPPLTPTPTPTRPPLGTVTPTPVSSGLTAVPVTGKAVLPPGSKVYFAEGGDISGTVDYRPACTAGCALSGDSTTFLWNMTWRTWTTVDAVGTGTEKIDDCDPNCAVGHVYAVPVTATFSDPVQAGCTAADSRLVWTRVSFAWPSGLPSALSGQNAPLNPFTYPELATPDCG